MIRTKAPILMLLSMLPLVCGCAGSNTSQNDSAMTLTIGTYGTSIYETSFSQEGSFGSLKPIKADNASYVILSEDGTRYAVSENDPNSGVYTFSNDGSISFETDTDFGPCHLLKYGDWIFTADYGRGCISIFPIVDGKVAPKADYIQFDGSGPHPERQTHSYIHQLRLLPEGICKALGIEGDWVLASDLGDDTIHVLKAGGESPLVHCESLDITLDDGTGPRHMEFSQKHNMLYCISELGGMLYSVKISSENGMPKFTVVGSVKADLVDAGGSADIHLHPNGEFLYTSHRLDNDGIAVFKLDQNGAPQMVSYHNTGIHPRNFQITPDGKYMLVACRDSYNVQAFEINQATGALSESAVSTLTIEKDQPVCIAF